VRDEPWPYQAALAAVMVVAWICVDPFDPPIWASALIGGGVAAVTIPVLRIVRRAREDA
jgi:hypothetical protein